MLPRAQTQRTKITVWHLHIYTCSGLYNILSFHLLSSPFFSSPLPSRNSDQGSHRRLFSPPTHYGSRLAFLSREGFSSFFLRRLALNCAYPRYIGDLSSWSSLNFAKKKNSPRRDSNSRTNSSSIRGPPILYIATGLPGRPVQVCTRYCCTGYQIISQLSALTNAATTWRAQLYRTIIGVSTRKATSKTAFNTKLSISI